MKRILVITEKLDKNDEQASFFHGQVMDMALRCAKVSVLVLEKKSHNLPANTAVYSLGKESGISKIGYLFSFFKIIIGKSKDYDAVFVHRNPIYIVLGGIFWKLSGKKIIFWYQHTHVDTTLKMATMFADVIYTGKQDGFPLKTKKLVVVSDQDNLNRMVCEA